VYGKNEKDWTIRSQASSLRNGKKKEEGSETKWDWGSET